MRVSTLRVGIALAVVLCCIVSTSHSAEQLTINDVVETSPELVNGIGDRLDRTFLLFSSQPLTASAAAAAGWEQDGGCNSQFGIRYTAKGGPTTSKPELLYFTSAGQLSGFGLRNWNEPPENLVPHFWVPVPGEKAHEILISTRNTSIMCSGHYDSRNGALGDRLWINQRFHIPDTARLAKSAGWVPGNCINQMGTHYAYDLNKPGYQTWNVSSLVPVMPMYNVATERISAVLFWSPHLERYEVLGPWEGPFIPTLFCGNWCAHTGCHFPGVHVFSTLHWMLTNPSQNNCHGAPCSLF